VLPEPGMYVQPEGPEGGTGPLLRDCNLSGIFSIFKTLAAMFCFTCTMVRRTKSTKIMLRTLMVLKSQRVSKHLAKDISIRVRWCIYIDS